MHWMMRLSGAISAAMLIIVLSPSLQSFPKTEAIRSTVHSVSAVRPSAFKTSPTFINGPDCASPKSTLSVCDPSLVHVAITLDAAYLRGSIAAVHSVMHHSDCPQSVFFHFLVSDSTLEELIRSTFPKLRFKVYYFDPEIVKSFISSSVRQALEQPLNYARNYLADLLEPCVRRVIYLDSDLVVVDDIIKLWETDLGGKTIGAPEYCHANFTSYFTNGFWFNERYG